MQVKEYIAKDLLAMIYAAGDQSEMMEESQEAATRREEMIRMYHTCNSALELIRDVSSKTGQSEQTCSWPCMCVYCYTHSSPSPLSSSSSFSSPQYTLHCHLQSSMTSQRPRPPHEAHLPLVPHDQLPLSPQLAPPPAAPPFPQATSAANDKPHIPRSVLTVILPWQ